MITSKIAPTLITDISALPRTPGVYLFKDERGQVCYIGKAKSLRDRVRSYLNNYGREYKATTIISDSVRLEHVKTATELEAMLLEAKLIQSYQPPCNVLLKTGQPYVYFLITQQPLPRFTLTKNKQAKGTYFGPFIERNAARKAHRYLEESFQLYLCKKAIPGGCLAYHMHRCAGICRDDFDEEGYRSRLRMVQRALTKGREEVIAELQDQVKEASAALNFERAAQLVKYQKAFNHVFDSVAAKFDRPQSLQRLADKDIWLWHEGDDEPFGTLLLLREKGGIVRTSRRWCVVRGDQSLTEVLHDYIEGYYRLFTPAQQILCTHELPDAVLLGQFITQWHALPQSVTVSAPPGLEHGEIMVLANLHAHNEFAKTVRSGQHLKRLLQLSKTPRTIDCFDISHKQGHAMVGSCVRFTDGRPDGNGYRRFHIKSLNQQNDFAALQEIVTRRYRNREDLPDIIVIDGGKGQLSAVRAVMGHRLVGTTTTLVSLAKREETVFGEQFPEGKILDQKSVGGQLLIALRDYAHHAAVSFHREGFERAAITKS
ncbi:MAG: excinuclease ABC subunit UvrC [Candidatus Dependentiae bacterium]|jgi:excinuclease ABC subunit C